MNVVVVAKTWRGSRVCIGGHDVESFRSLRLLGSDGQNQREDSPMEIGDVWELTTAEHDEITPPHVEDIRVLRGRRVDRIENLAEYLGARVSPWVGPPTALFDGRLRGSGGGSGYVPLEGPLPAMSTGYWRPDSLLSLREQWQGKLRYWYLGASPIKRISYVGVAEPAQIIASGSLVRVSLSHAFTPEGQPSGFWLQLSGSYNA